MGYYIEHARIRRTAALIMALTMGAVTLAASALSSVIGMF